MDVVAELSQWTLTINAWAASLGWPLEGLLRLLLATTAGALVGLEREVRGRQAGFRTNLLVCLGSALVMIVSISLATTETWRGSGSYQINVDPGRIAYGVMTGIGFLGAGTITQAKGSVRGLTTAAGMWCVAAIGLAVGLGLYVTSAFATLLVLVALWFLDYVEDGIPKVRYRTVTVRRAWKVGVIADTVDYFRKAKFDVVDASFERTGDLRDADISIRIAFVNKQQYYNFERQLEGNDEYQLLATREL